MGIGAVVRAYKTGRAREPDAMVASEEIATDTDFAPASRRLLTSVSERKRNVTSSSRFHMEKAKLFCGT